ncbi:acetyl-CoA carboxylase biotin carboxyl carrier protein subunit [Pararhizobium sp. A13]|uniref:acetyl-CoA carboxylase biotin carboxyl carrier protein n=1 Tax=Pararhizobium sp. A13 TaxID=3133975 RepID=UPI00311B247D
MDLSKIKTLIDFVGQSKITELTVSEKETTVRIFRTATSNEGVPLVSVDEAPTDISRGPPTASAVDPGLVVTAPVYGVLHAAPAPGENAFVKLGDEVEAGQTLFIIEAMKVFNKIAAPRSGRLTRLTDIDGGEVEVGDMLAEIA